MSKGGSKTRTTDATTQYALPSWLDDGARNTFQTVNSFTQPFLQQPPAQAIAGFSPLQQQSFTLAQQLAASPLGAALDPNAFAALGEYTAPRIEAPAMAAPSAVTPASVSAQRFSDANIENYLNPYRRAIIDDAMARLARENDQSLVKVNARASAAEAFGGSRHAVESAEQTRSYLQTAAETANTMHAQAFEAARRSIEADQNRAFQAAAQNAQLAQQAALLKQQQTMQAALSEQDAALRVALANQAAQQQGADFRLQALAQARNTELAAQEQRLAAIGIANELGAQQQALEQAGLDVPWHMLDRQIAAAAGLPHGYTTTTSGRETTKSSGGLLDSLIGGLSVLTPTTGLGKALSGLGLNVGLR
jgi:hypothetical protein